MTDDRKIFERALIYHDSSAIAYFGNQLDAIETQPFCGTEFRTNEVSAAILRCQLDRLDGILGDLRKNKRLLSESVPDELKDRPAVYLVYDGELIGAIELSDTVREESKSVISKLKKLGIAKTVMLTGDKKSAAHSVAKKLGIDTYHSELLPDKKLEIINDLKREGHTVCFVGDGINDAPVLSVSNCGAAMGLGSEAAIESSDMVLSSGNLTQLPKAVKIARSVMRTIKGNILFALAVKALVIILACLGLAAIWMSVIADTGVCVICVLISARLLKKKY